MTTRRTFAALLITVLMALGACGDDDSAVPATTDSSSVPAGEDAEAGSTEDEADGDSTAGGSTEDEPGEAGDEPGDDAPGDDASEGGDSGAADDTYCELALQATRVVGRDYVGTDEHVAEFDAMIAVAPDDIVDVFRVVRNHMDTAVSPSNPDSQDFENFPPDVQTAALAAQQHIEDNC